MSTCQRHEHINRSARYVEGNNRRAKRRISFSKFGKQWVSLTVERDLVILVHNDLHVYQHCQAANKANRMLGMINRAFTLSQKGSFYHFINHWYDLT